jgi:hypothetical protein
MSLHNLAKHVQEKGRGNDQMLVHMTPKEVQGLQALAKAHGGSLSVNPETGLVEAGFLESVLPIVAAAAATYFTAGAAAPALEAALAAEGVGAATAATVGGIGGGALAGAGVGAASSAIQGKDVGNGALYGGLGGAIAGGMGAYGTGAPSAIDQTAKVVEGVNAGQQTADIARQMADPNAGLAGTSGTIPGANAPQINPNMSTGYNGEGLNYNPGPGYGSAQSGPPTPQQLSDVKSFTGAPQPPAAPPSYYSTMSGPGKVMTQALPGLGADIGMNIPKPYNNTTQDAANSAVTLSPNFQGYTPPQPKPYYQPQYTRYAADGGLMALASGGSPEDKKKKQRAGLTADRTMAAMDPYQAGLANLNNARHGANMTGVSALNPSMLSLGELPSNAVAGAGGGLANLGGYSDGGRLLKGPGDGMSDHIPAQIGAKQPARLADGEFVVPADVVSHLGNGSTDAGAKRLYSMMDKVRQARTGKKKQAPAVNFKQGVPV